jgi:integrase
MRSTASDSAATTQVLQERQAGRKVGNGIDAAVQNTIDSIPVDGSVHGGFGDQGHHLFMRKRPKARGRVSIKWIVQWKVDGRTCSVTVGSYPRMSFAAACRERDKLERQTDDWKKSVLSKRRQKDLSAADKQTANVLEWTFDEAARQVLANEGKDWQPIRRRKFELILEKNVSPVVGRLRIAEIEQRHAIAALAPVWARAPKHCAKVAMLAGQVVAAVTAYEAFQRKHPRFANPFDWKRLRALQQFKGKLAETQHRRAMPHAEIAALFAGPLRTCDSRAAPAVELMILTGVRPNEAAGAHAREFDLATATWTIPAERMKARAEHRVALSRQAVALVRERVAAGGFIFPGRSAGQPIVVELLNHCVKEQLKLDFDAHGFRTSLRGWAEESGKYHKDVCEAVIAHETSRSKSERAYRRDQEGRRIDFLEQRRELMQEWADYVAPRKLRAVS